MQIRVKDKKQNGKWIVGLALLPQEKKKRNEKGKTKKATFAPNMESRMSQNRDSKCNLVPRFGTIIRDPIVFLSRFLAPKRILILNETP